MTTEEIISCRELLLKLYDEKRPITAMCRYEGSDVEFIDSSYESNVIKQLYNFDLLGRSFLYNEEVDGEKKLTVYLFKLTLVGSLLGSMRQLNELYINDENLVGFNTLGDNIYKILSEGDEQSVSLLNALLTTAEKTAWEHYCKWNVSKSTKKTKIVKRTEDVRSGLLSMFDMSVYLGARGTDETRHEYYVLSKAVEELGELSVELQISSNLSYKTKGSDGIEGEAVDLAICAMDMFALQFPNCSAEDIEYMFITIMNEKLLKWENSLGRL